MRRKDVSNGLDEGRRKGEYLECASNGGRGLVVAGAKEAKVEAGKRARKEEVYQFLLESCSGCCGC